MERKTTTRNRPIAKTSARKTKANENGTGPAPRLTGDFLSSSLLAYLRQWNAYGYQLVQELGKAGMENFDSTTVYRTLRHLEKAGLVSSFWDTSKSGPARRMYAITKAGETFLDLFMDVFTRYSKILQSALHSLDNFDSSADRGASKSQTGTPARRRKNNG